MTELNDALSLDELNKLEAYLRENGIEYERKDEEPKTQFGVTIHFARHQIVCKDKNGKYMWDAICHPFSYGYEQGLLEIMGVLVDEEKDGDSVVGYLTADDVIKRIEEFNAPV